MSAVTSVDQRRASNPAEVAGSVSGAVRWTLRAEGFALFVAATAAYAKFDLAWGLFAALFLAPDLTFLAYLAGPRRGAFAYNLVHSTIGPLILAGIGATMDAPLALSVGLIGLAHIGVDRALGFGLKYPSAFGDTHLNSRR